jgi:hypothetical protein
VFVPRNVSIYRLLLVDLVKVFDDVFPYNIPVTGNFPVGLLAPTTEPLRRCKQVNLRFEFPDEVILVAPDTLFTSEEAKVKRVAPRGGSIAPEIAYLMPEVRGVSYVYHFDFVVCRSASSRNPCTQAHSWQGNTL